MPQHAAPHRDSPLWAVPIVDEQAARRMLEPRRWRRVRAIWKRLTRRKRAVVSPTGTCQSATSLPKLTLVWLPFFRVSLVLSDQAPSVPQHAASTPEGRADTVMTQLRVLVDGYEQAVSWDDLPDGVWQAEPLSRAYPPSCTVTDAERLAIQFVVRWQLQSGGRSAAVQKQPQVVDIQSVHCPYWAYYFQRRPGILDVRLLDAVRGQVAGPRAKASLLAALATHAALPTRS